MPPLCPDDLMKSRDPSPVYHHGQIVGTLPADFHPQFFNSTSWFAQFRPGDFKWDGSAWIAHPTLGPRDLDSIEGFQRNPA